jgi:tRNA(Ile2)-agmatinylcytidine synthase
VRLHLGIDDTDSRGGGCTTHAAAVLVEKLSQLGCKFIDYPNIIRLNPNIPFKTRGNAAVAIRIDIRDDMYQEIENVAIDTVEKFSRIGERGTDPALVLLRGDPGAEIRHIARAALYELLSADSVLRVIKRSSATAVLYGAKLGIVGATAAVGQTLKRDHTFELIAYRIERNRGTPRRLEKESVMLIHRIVPETFNSYDEENRRVLIAPHGPDPVLVGIRGETPRAVLHAFRMVKIHEPVERWMIFRTNHGTDAHFQLEKQTVRAHSPTVFTGTVISAPIRTRGGHVFCSIAGRAGELKCAAFEPTGSFRKVIAELIPGDKVTVFGGVHAESNRTINLEKIVIHRLAKSRLVRNPSCRKCTKRLKSAGRGKGFKCVRCGWRIKDLKKIVVITERKIVPGIYLPSQKANRHLTKPLTRYGREKTWDGLPPIGHWHNP